MSARRRTAEQWAADIAHAEELSERYAEMLDLAKRLDLGAEQDRLAELVTEYSREADTLTDAAIAAGAIR